MVCWQHSESYAKGERCVDGVRERPKRHAALEGEKKRMESAMGAGCEEFADLSWDRFGVVSMKSSIVNPGENTGIGLFAQVDYEVGDVVTEYAGTVKRATGKTTAVDTHDAETHDGFVIRGFRATSSSVTVRSCGQMINDARSNKRNNAERMDISVECVQIDDPNPNNGRLVKNMSSRMFIVARKPIAAGEEIYTQYGSDYWSKFDSEV